MPSETSEEFPDDNDSNTTIFSTSSQGSAMTLMNLRISELQRTLTVYNEQPEYPCMTDVQVDEGASDQRNCASEPVEGPCPKMSYKEYCRRVRKCMSNREYAIFLDRIAQVHELRSAREVSYGLETPLLSQFFPINSPVSFAYQFFLFLASPSSVCPFHPLPEFCLGFSFLKFKTSLMLVHSLSCKKTEYAKIVVLCILLVIEGF